jgi:hypothetical protein
MATGRAAAPVPPLPPAGDVLDPSATPAPCERPRREIRGAERVPAWRDATTAETGRNGGGVPERSLMLEPRGDRSGATLGAWLKAVPRVEGEKNGIPADRVEIPRTPRRSHVDVEPSEQDRVRRHDAFWDPPRPCAMGHPGRKPRGDAGDSVSVNTPWAGSALPFGPDQCRTSEPVDARRPVGVIAARTPLGGRRWERRRPQ